MYHLCITVTFLALWSMAAISCTDSNKGKQDIQTEIAQTSPTQKPATIYVYVYNAFPKEIKRALIDSLKAHYPICVDKGTIHLPKNAYYKPNHRYLADSLLADLTARRTEKDYIVGLTSVDISMPLHGYPDYGIMGKANSLGGHSALFSNFRCHTIPDLFKLMQHELGHAFGLRHCPNKDCIMQNAERKNKFGHLPAFCPQCKEKMEAFGWKF